jgi:small-conductance mechanosensitive channel
METLLETIVPGPPLRGAGVVITLLLGIVMSLTIAPFVERARTQLSPTGLLPDLASLVATTLRILAVILGLGLVAAILPPGLARAFPWVVIAGAVAVGWTARDAVQDMFAWAWLSAEGRLKPGHHLRVGPLTGQLERISPRAAWLRDAQGEHIVIPNRRLLTQAVHVRDATRHPVALNLPLQATYAEASHRVADAVRRLPWAAPEGFELEPQGDNGWRITLHVLDPVFEVRTKAVLSALASADPPARSRPAPNPE